MGPSLGDGTFVIDDNTAVYTGLWTQWKRKTTRTTLVWASTWDSGSDAGEFADALIENYGVQGEEISDVADIPGVPGAKKLWKSDATMRRNSLILSR